MPPRPPEDLTAARERPYTGAFAATGAASRCVKWLLFPDIKPGHRVRARSQQRSPGVFFMTRKCELTGKLPMSGQIRSHAENKTKRVFRPNLCQVSLMSEALNRSFRLKVSAHALKSVEHRGGLDAFLMKARKETLSPRVQKIKRDVAKAKDAQAAETQGAASEPATP
jgi:large subunit ribosomal protein L28